MEKKMPSKKDIQENFSFMNLNKEKGINKQLRKSIKDIQEGKRQSNKKEMFFNTKNLSPSPRREIADMEQRRSKSTRRVFQAEDD